LGTGSGSDPVVPNDHACRLVEWVNKVPAREGEEKVIQREITCGNLRLTKLPRLEKETARGKRRETAWKQGVIKTSHGKSKESDKKRRKEKDLNPRLGYRKVTTQKNYHLARFALMK
jgi:hypothetical protein